MEKYRNNIKAILKENSKIKYAFLFGSGAKTLRPQSDIDILVGGDLEFNDVTDLSMKLESKFNRKVDIVLTDAATSDVILKAFFEGELILVNDREEMKKDYFKNLYLYENSGNLRKLRTKRVRRRYADG
ncbi:MAG: nucleotidyltransferase domain-containing protein [Candidatus Omnitrophota bacterium]